jgi:6-bladed beta-propeller
MKSGLLRSAVGLVAVLSSVTTAAAQTIDLPAADKGITGSAEKVFSVGKEEGQPWEVFSSIAGVAFDGSGNLYVLDRDNSRVVVFGPDGKHLRDVGSKGEGPGEFVLPMGIAVLSDDRLAVFDMGNRAVSLFDTKGAYQAIVRPDPSFGQTQQAIVAGPDGGFLVAGSQISAGRGGPPEIRDSIPVLRVAPDGKTTLVLKEASPKPVMNVSGDAGRQMVRVSPPPTFSPSVSWTPLSDGRIAASAGGTYQISLYTLDGNKSAVLRRPVPQRKVTDRDKDLAKKQRRATMESGTGSIRVTNVNGRQSMSAGGSLPPQEIERALAGMTFAETVPVIRALRGDRDGRLWVQRDGGPGNEDYPIDIVSAAGNYLGTIKGMRLPDAFGPDGRYAMIESDDLGVQSVVVWRIPRTMLGR